MCLVGNFVLNEGRDLYYSLSAVLSGTVVLGFPCSSIGKEPAASAGDMRCRFDSWVGKIPGGGNDNMLQYS